MPFEADCHGFYATVYLVLASTPLFHLISLFTNFLYSDYPEENVSVRTWFSRILELEPPKEPGPVARKFRNFSGVFRDHKSLCIENRGGFES